MGGWRRWEIGEVKEGDEEWPGTRLRSVRPRVKKLYYRGNWDKAIFDKCLAVVGTRKMTSYGESVVERIIPGIVNAGVTIVSGFMYGVDSKAHEVCIESGGKTIAVLGSGLNEFVPKSNDELYTQVLESGGLVLSEYEAEAKSQRWFFPQRNRIVAGLSQATLVIEGGEKSGTLVTAKITLEQKKKVLAVPGRVGSSLGVATNSLIKAGAVLVTSSDEVLKEMGIGGKSGQKRKVDVEDGLAGKVIGELKAESLDIDELVRRLNVSVVELSQKLSQMQLKGLVEERLGKYIVL